MISTLTNPQPAIHMSRTSTKPPEGPTLAQRLTEARENLAYWRRRKEISRNPAQAAHAGGLEILWRAQVNSLVKIAIPAKFQS